MKQDARSGKIRGLCTARASLTNRITSAKVITTTKEPSPRKFHYRDCRLPATRQSDDENGVTRPQQVRVCVRALCALYSVASLYAC